MPPKIGIVAGGGDLPARLAAACRASGRAAFVVAIEGQAEDGTFDDGPDAWSGLAKLGRTLALLRDAGCEEVVLAGRLRRPDLGAIRPDARGAKLLAALATTGFSDNAALSAIVAELEKEGFRVVGADDVLADLVAPAGALGRHAPSAEERRDIELAARVATTLGSLDVGQAAVVHGGVVLGVEAQEGTDALIRRCGDLRPAAAGGVLVKMCKPLQDRRVDLPSIGPATLAAARAAGLGGIAVEAGSALIVDRETVIRLADEAGLFVVGIPRPSA